MKRIIVFLIFMSSLISAEVTVRVVGDSHSVNSFCNIGEEKGIWKLQDNDNLIFVPFSIYNMYGVTMHRIGRDGLSLLEEWRRDLIGANDGDVLVFVFGEIDVRCHVLKQSEKQGVSVDTIIEKLVDSYLKTALEYKNLYNQLEVVVFNVVPPIDRVHLPPYEQYGTLEERVIIAKKLNQLLMERSNKQGIKFLDVYSLFSGEDGSMQLELSDGSVHISPHYNDVIKKELCKLVGIVK